jgi:hypothetical protein
MRLVHPHDRSQDYDDLRGGGWADALSLISRLGCPFPHGSILARKDVFRILGGYPHAPQFAHCEDFALWSTWVRFFKVGILNEVLFEYTVSDGQISQRFAEQQRRASMAVQRGFLNLGSRSGQIPEAAARIAQRLRLPLLDASKTLALAWMFYDHILADPELCEAAEVMFPDRAVHPYSEVVNLVADRYFYLHAGSFDRQLSQHARRVDTPETVAPLTA